MEDVGEAEQGGVGKRNASQVHAHRRVIGNGPWHGNGWQAGHVEEGTPRRPPGLGREILRMGQGQERTNTRRVRGEHWGEDGIDAPFLGQQVGQPPDMRPRRGQLSGAHAPALLSDPLGVACRRVEPRQTGGKGRAEMRKGGPGLRIRGNGHHGEAGSL